MDGCVKKNGKIKVSNENYFYFCPQSIKRYVYEQENATIFSFVCLNDPICRYRTKHYGER